jgi:single-strand DNA-binding protein
MYEANGKLKWIGETQAFSSGFTKREFVVTTAHDKYPQDLKFETVKDKCAMLDSFECGQEVQVSFDIRGNEYNGKYYVNLSCWKLQAASGGGPPSQPSRPPHAASQPASSKEPTMDDLRQDEDFDDDPPF